MNWSPDTEAFRPHLTAARPMRIEQTPLPGMLLIEPRVFSDERGFFLESFNEERFRKHGLPEHFAQDNHSRSVKGVLRGLHYQMRYPQGKLVTVISGSIFDVAVDIRRDSPTFGKWHGLTLTSDQPRYAWIPPGFAHGLLVLSEVADVVYKCTELYRPEDENGIMWNDPALGIEWPISRPLLSDKDRRYANFAHGPNDVPSAADAAIEP